MSLTGSLSDLQISIPFFCAFCLRAGTRAGAPAGSGAGGGGACLPARVCVCVCVHTRVRGAGVGRWERGWGCSRSPGTPNDRA